MYWYNKKNDIRKAAVAIAFAALFVSCSTDPATKRKKTAKQIDVPAFFKQEVERLQREKPLVLKTVTKDDLSEKKELQIENWANELASFQTIDLNKPAYADVLTKDSTANTLIYSSTDPEIDLSYVEIQFNKAHKPVNWIIKRTIKNSLYQTEEVLKYYSDSAYSIEKEQSVLILGDKRYGVEANFIK